MVSLKEASMVRVAAYKEAMEEAAKAAVEAPPGSQVGRGGASGYRTK